MMVAVAVIGVGLLLVKPLATPPGGIRFMLSIRDADTGAPITSFGSEPINSGLILKITAEGYKDEFVDLRPCERDPRYANPSPLARLLSLDRPHSLVVCRLKKR
jgi:hypothetical protein